MKRTSLHSISVVFFTLAILAMSCQFLPGTSPVETLPSVEIPISIDQPVLITGGYEYTNDIITTYYSEYTVALVDMNGFVIRDEEWEIPVAGQSLGYLTVDGEAKKGTYRLQLPAQPLGTMVDVDHDGQKDTGLQVFAVSFWGNLAGGPYAEGDDPAKGWPDYLASVRTDTENKNEVVGGMLVVWSPDSAQDFPTGFGPDGRLFTDDDPVGKLQAGYTVVDLDKDPFGQIRSAEVDVTLYEPADAKVKDYAALSYTEAFNKMLEQIRLEYAFNGITGKQPDWDALDKEFSPRVADAERQSDERAYFKALYDFTQAFHDGHVSVSGSDYIYEMFAARAGGGFGFSVREIDDGRIIVNFLQHGGPADQAGIRLGAEITDFNGMPVKQAIEDVQPLFGPYSTDFSRRYDQILFLTRAPVGMQVSVSFTNQNASPQTETLVAVNEQDSLFANMAGNKEDAPLPVEFYLLESGVGYVKLNSNYDDLNLIVRLFERALKFFKDKEVPGIIIDMRENLGGAWLGLAGYLTDEEIPLGQMEYYSEKSGKFEPDGVRDTVTPFEEQYHFDRMALLVGLSCYSACEIDAYGFSQVPGMIVVGETPTAGVEAEVARGQFEMPGGFSLQIPTGRMTLPDGSVFLEGKGVPPTLKVPVTADNVLRDTDVVLKAAEEAILKK